MVIVTFCSKGFHIQLFKLLKLSSLLSTLLENYTSLIDKKYNYQLVANLP